MNDASPAVTFEWLNEVDPPGLVRKVPTEQMVTVVDEKRARREGHGGMVCSVTITSPVSNSACTAKTGGQDRMMETLSERSRLCAGPLTYKYYQNLSKTGGMNSLRRQHTQELRRQN